MDTPTQNDIGDAVFELLTEFDHTSLTYLIADLCVIRGWTAEVAKGDASVYGDIVARQIVPHPKSVIIMNQTDSVVDEDSLTEFIQNSTQTPEIKYTVITAQKPTETAIDFADNHDIGIISIGDLVGMILRENAVDLVYEYASQDDQIESKHDDLLSMLNEGASEPIEFEQEDTKEEEDLDRPRDRPLSESRRLTLGLVGYDAYEQNGSVEGMLIAVKITAKEDLQITPANFSLSFEDGTVYEAADGTESNQFGKIEGLLQPSWTVGDVSLSEGESCRYLLYVPTSTDSAPIKLALEDCRIPMQPPIRSQTFRGLPGPVATVLSDVLGCTLIEGHKESYVSYGLDDYDTQQQSTDQVDEDTITQDNLPVDLPTYTESAHDLTLPEGAVGTVGEYLNIELLGHEYVTTQSESGVLVAIQVSAKAFDLEIRPDYFSLHSEDQRAYESTGKKKSRILRHCISSTDDWETEKSEISAGGWKNYVLFFPAPEEIMPRKIRYKTSYKRLFTMGYDQIEEITGKSKNSEAALEFEISPEDAEMLRGLPDTAPDVMDSEDILQSHVVGGEGNQFAVEIGAWDFYRSTGKYLSDETQDGLFISLEVIGKQPGASFNSKYIEMLDSDGFVHQARASTAMGKMDFEEFLNSPWRISRSSGIDLPSNGKIKALIHIPCAEPFTPTEIRLDGNVEKQTIEVLPESWNNLRGLPDSVHNAICNINYERG